MTPTYKQCTYTDACGITRHAVAIKWAHVTEILGRPHGGLSRDDERLVAWLREQGAPAWVIKADLEGGVDESHWYLTGDEVDPDGSILFQSKNDLSIHLHGRFGDLSDADHRRVIDQVAHEAYCDGYVYHGGQGKHDWRPFLAQVTDDRVCRWLAGRRDTITDDTLEKIDFGGIQIVRGYLWLITPDSKEALTIGEDEVVDGFRVPARRVGYHGLDTPPCDADWTADHDDGYLVITSSADIPACIEGWSVVPADVERGDVWDDGACATVIIDTEQIASDDVLATYCVLSQKVR